MAKYLKLRKQNTFPIKENILPIKEKNEKREEENKPTNERSVSTKCSQMKAHRRTTYSIICRRMIPKHEFCTGVVDVSMLFHRRKLFFFFFFFKQF